MIFLPPSLHTADHRRFGYSSIVVVLFLLRVSCARSRVYRTYLRVPYCFTRSGALASCHEILSAENNNAPILCGKDMGTSKNVLEQSISEEAVFFKLCTWADTWTQASLNVKICPDAFFHSRICPIFSPNFSFLRQRDFSPNTLSKQAIYHVPHS